MATRTTEALALSVEDASRLAAWLSPSFPIGSYSYSHGFERAVELGRVTDATTLLAWLRGILRHGAARADAVLMAHAWRRAHDADALREVATLACALRPSAELARESQAQGAAFLDTVRAVWPSPLLEDLHRNLAEWRLPVVMPVAAGVACRAHELPLEPSLALQLHAFTANLVSAGVRLVPLGQTDGQRVIAALETCWTSVARDAAGCELDDVTSATPNVEVLSMQHETQYTRLFRS
jgi:urease accessory protein